MSIPACLILQTCVLLAPHPSAKGPATGPFAASRWAPADVSALVQIENASDLWRKIADRPIAQWLGGMVKKSSAHKAWTDLSQAAQVEPLKLFDECLGRRCSFMSRCGGEWAIVTEVDDATIARLMQRLNARVREPRFGMAVAELPEQEMLLARNGESLVIGPTGQPALFYEILPRMEQPDEDSLSNQPCMTRATEIGTGTIGVYLRHDEAIGGSSLAVAELREGQLIVRHAATFEHAPFNRGVTSLDCDLSPALLFERHALAAVAQPTDVGDGPVEAFLAASLGEGLISNPMRANMGDRRLLVVGEAEGRQLARPVDVLSTTFVACLQVRDPDIALQQLDAQMIKVARRINDLGRGSFLVRSPSPRCLHSQDPREVDISPASDWFTGGFPIMKNVSLNWTVADGPAGAWFVIASHRKSMEDVVEALKSPCPTDAKYKGKFDSCGVSNGSRIGRHLRSWSDEAHLFADPANVEEFRSTLQLMSELAASLQTCRWQLARPSPTEMRLNLQVQLSPPESTRSE